VANIVKGSVAPMAVMRRRTSIIRSVTSKIQDAFQGLIDGELWRCGGILLEHRAGSGGREGRVREPVRGSKCRSVGRLEVGGEVGDLVRQVDELGFQRGELG